jgi:hypothetical protein
LKSPHRESAIAPGIRAVRDHLRPFLLIQVCVLLVALAYYRWPQFAEFASGLGSIKRSGGLLFSCISTAFAGVILPEIFKALSKDPRRLGASEIAYNIAISGLNGIIVDLLYQGLGMLLGQEPTVPVVAAKVAIDQALAAPFFFTPYFLFMILWRKSGFNFGRFRAVLQTNPFVEQIWPIQIVSWAYWIPALVGIYAMPGDLQFMLFLFVEAAWSLILLHVAKRHA